MVRLHWDQRRRLQSLASPRAADPRAALRARIVLLAARGLTTLAIARALRISPPTAGLWRRRFLAHGVSGLLRDAPRSGRPPVIPPSTVAAVLQARGVSRASRGRPRSSREVARELGLSRSSVQRIWRAHATPPRTPPRGGPTDEPTGFLDQVTDLVGLYVHQPERAVAFATDDRLAGGRPRPTGSRPNPRAPVRPRGAEFVAFLRRTEEETPRPLEVHLLLEARGIPPPPEVFRWLSRHPRVHLHTLPAGADGAGMIDRLVDGFAERRDRPGASESAHRLKYALREHLRQRRPGVPFVWTAASWEIRGAYGRKVKE